MPKRIVILDPNGVEVANETTKCIRRRIVEAARLEAESWEDAARNACEDLAEHLKRENPKLGTYTVTVKETE